MRLTWNRPRIVEVYDAPQLAVLAVLEAALDVAEVTLVAAHPYDLDLDDPRVDDRAGRALVAAVQEVAAAVARYRLALALTRDGHEGDLPF